MSASIKALKTGCRPAVILALWIVIAGAQADELLPPGFRPLPPGVHALVGGKVVVKPGRTLNPATILIRDGKIEGVGPNLTPPADARVWDMRGLTVYAGFIESYWPLTKTNAPTGVPASQSRLPDLVTPGLFTFYGTAGQRADAGQPGPGYESEKIMPEFRVANVYSPEPREVQRLRELGFTAAVAVPARGIVRGISALVTLADADPNRLIVRDEVFQHIALDPRDSGGRGYPITLMGAVAAVRQCFFDAQHHALDQADWRKNPAGRTRPEFNPALEALGPAAAGRQRVVFEPGSALMVDRAARIARELNLDFALLACGEEWRRPDLARETGATFIVPVDFPKLPRWPEPADWEQATLDQLRAWDWAPENPALLRQQGLEIALTTYGLTDKREFRENLRQALARGLSEDDALAALTTVPARLCGVDNLLGSIEPGKLANLTVVDGGGYFDTNSHVRAVWIEGQYHHLADAKPLASIAGAGKTNAVAETIAPDRRVARSPLAGRGPITDPPSLRVRGAVLWTCGPAGVLTNAELVVRDGKIERVGRTASSTQVAMTLDLAGRHITPGLIDPHSHSMILGLVNEDTLPSSAMCRIGDVINSESVNLRLQLAGGVTTANQLHGSGNPIGGQDQVIKLRDGEGPEGLKFAGAPPGIKFALGENPKQSHLNPAPGAGRYPQTRMGLPVFFANRLTAARQYLQAWADHAKRGGVPPRRNLELEALGEVLEGRRLIHVHSYRQDEMLAFLRLMEEFGVRVATLEHGFEGYKIADEIAAHGAGVSTSADWWAYKFETYDAIPQAAALMRERGVLVALGSDSADVARRLNTEAAKMVRYGGLSEVEALKLVTVNPARQLGIAERVGSLEPGKDADFVVWSGPPLDARSVVLEVWIDGRKYFDRAVETERIAALVQEREQLIAKARKTARPARVGDGDESRTERDDKSFFRQSREHEYDGLMRACEEACR